MADQKDGQALCLTVNIHMDDLKHRVTVQSSKNISITMFPTPPSHLVLLGPVNMENIGCLGVSIGKAMLMVRM